MEKILPISLRLNFTPKSSGYYGLILKGSKKKYSFSTVEQKLKRCEYDWNTLFQSPSIFSTYPSGEISRRVCFSELAVKRSL